MVRRHMSVCDSGHRKVSVVRIKQVYNFAEKKLVFRRDKQNCPLYTGDRIRRVSVERGCTVRSC